MNFRKLKKTAASTQIAKILKKRSVQYGLGVAAVLIIALYALDNTVKPTTVAAMSSTSVEIVRNDRRSGGTGVIFESGSSESKILTNGHVCKVIVNGGLVISDDGSEHAVTSYKLSKEHDLCLLTVASDLGISTRIASKASAPYAAAAISGHPSLLPNIVTRGHFSSRMMVSVLIGFQKCTEEDMAGPNGIMCLLLGGIPEVRRYETQVVSATIMPGSSGSAVFNDKGEISALVFAGAGDIGYAMTVPYESIANFVQHEAATLDKQFPDNTISLVETEQNKRLRAACANRVMPENEQLAEACRAISSDMLWSR